MSNEITQAKELADTYLDEIIANIEIRKAYNNIIVSQAPSIYSAVGDNKHARENLQLALKYKATDPSSLYKPLVVQINGIFENYIRTLVKAVIEERYEKARTYSCLNENFRRNHISYAAKVLSQIKTGAIMGVAYNFDTLLGNLGKSLSEQEGFKLNPEIYTILMGNCTSTRIEDLFDALELPKPFSDDLGKNKDLQAHFSEKTKGRVAKRSSEMLDKQIDLRNDIVHGNLTRSVDLSELNESINFFRALISGLDELVDT